MLSRKMNQKEETENAGFRKVNKQKMGEKNKRTGERK